MHPTLSRKTIADNHPAGTRNVVLRTPPTLDQPQKKHRNSPAMARRSNSDRKTQARPGVELVSSKLTSPRLNPDLVERPHLVRQLDSASTAALTVITAPAGFGKTTLLADWLATVSGPSAWLALDEEDNDLARFTAYLVAAIRSVFPRGVQAVTDLLNASGTPNALQLSAALSNALGEVPDDFVLVLEDYHLIRNPDIHTLLGYLLRHFPHPLHLVISSRTDLPFSLTGLRASGQLCELRARDLRFSCEEATAFLQRLVGPEFEPEKAQLLHERTEGWPSALRFAALLLRQGCAVQEIIGQLLARNANQFMDYMLAEVLGQQSPALQEFLLQTALLDDLTVELAEAVVQDRGDFGVRMLWNELTSVWQDSLVVRLDAPEPTYRYHHLLREFLRLRARNDLDYAARVQVHQRAADWYTRQGYVTFALKHILAAGDVCGAARLLETNLFEMLEQERGRALLQEWLGLFPPEWRDQLPELVQTRLLLDTINQRVASLPALVSRLEQLLDVEPESDPARSRRFAAGLATARTQMASAAHHPALVIKSAAQALELLPERSLYLRGTVLIERAIALQMSGHSGTAVQELSQVLKQDDEPSPQLTLRALTGLALVHLYDGNLSGVALTANTILRLAKDQFKTSANWAHYLLGIVHYEWNHLPIAAQHFAAAAELRPVGIVNISIASLAQLAVTQQAQGLDQAACDTWEDLTRFATELRAGTLIYEEGGYRAQLDLMQDEQVRALRWAQNVVLSSRPNWMFEVAPHLTRLHILATSRKQEDLQMLLDATRSLLAQAEREHNTWRQIELEALQALALDKLGQTAAGLDALERSITLAEGGDFVRIYVDLGPRMARLLNLLLERRVSMNQVQRILAANVPGWTVPASNSSDSSDSDARWIEPLTLREMQVLEQLAQRRTDKEIADTLVISRLTVKAHTEHIYRKLAVNSRQEAVKVGVAFGILNQAPDYAARV